MSVRNTNLDGDSIKPKRKTKLLVKSYPRNILSLLKTFQNRVTAGRRKFTISYYFNFLKKQKVQSIPIQRENKLTFYLFRQVTEIPILRSANLHCISPLKLRFFNLISKNYSKTTCQPFLRVLLCILGF